MKTIELLPAIDAEAILGKSKIYARRALRCKDAGDLDEYQLWASLALELLGKACLAQIHPCLVVNPTDHVSLLAAAGINLGTDIKTITTKTLYDRLRHIAKGFDDKVKNFCDRLSQRRNAELHSGELPFREMRLQVWEGRFWHASQIVLDRMGSSLEEWLGATLAKAPKEIVIHARKAVIEAATVRIQDAKDTFDKRPKKEKAAALSAIQKFSASAIFYGSSDANWHATCPACGAMAVMGGVKFEEVIVAELPGRENDLDEELVEIHYDAEEFACSACDLRLTGQDEIEAAGLDDVHVDTETRERRYEDEYNNE